MGEEQFEENIDPELEAMIEDAKRNGVELTDAYIQNLKDSKDQGQVYKESYSEATKIFQNIINGVKPEEAEQIVEILKTGNQADIDTLTEGLIQLFG